MLFISPLTKNCCIWYIMMCVIFIYLFKNGKKIGNESVSENAYTTINHTQQISDVLAFILTIVRIPYMLYHIPYFF